MEDREPAADTAMIEHEKSIAVQLALAELPTALS